MRLDRLLLIVAIAGCAQSDHPAISLPAISLNKPSFGVDGATLSWSIEEGKGDLESSLGHITAFTIERKRVSSELWELVAEHLDFTRRSFVDRNVVPATEYHYRISLEVPKHQANLTGLSKNSSIAVTESLVDTSAIWSFRWSHPSTPSSVDARGSVFVLISKYEKSLGRVEVGHLHHEGDKVGWWEEAGNSAPVALHRVSVSGGRQLDIDFNTGVLLHSVAKMRGVVGVPGCTTAFYTDGKTGCTDFNWPVEFELYTITYLDDLGFKVHCMPLPDIRNKFCEEHRSAEAVQKENLRKTIEAKALLEKADEMWSRDSEAAIKIYAALLKRYKAQIVRLQTLTKVESRARQSE